MADLNKGLELSAGRGRVAENVRVCLLLYMYFLFMVLRFMPFLYYVYHCTCIYAIFFLWYCVLRLFYSLSISATRRTCVCLYFCTCIYAIFFFYGMRFMPFLLSVYFYTTVHIYANFFLLYCVLCLFILCLCLCQRLLQDPSCSFRSALVYARPEV